MFVDFVGQLDPWIYILQTNYKDIVSQQTPKIKWFKLSIGL